MEFDLQQKPLRTWSHLAANRKKPNEYDIVSRKLHYSMNNPDAPWEQSPESPMNRWYKQYRNNTALKHPDWDAFSDPDRLVYRTYNLLQDGQETHVQSLFNQFNERDHDKMLDPEWVSMLANFYTPLRYLCHALQMSSAYVMQLAPASTISNCATFQSSDLLRRVTHISYRTYELSLSYPDAGFGTGEREVWESAAQFQPMRKLIEKQLIAYDWSEAVISLTHVVLPMVSEGVMRPLSRQSHDGNDTLLPLLFDSEQNDSLRHHRWAKELNSFLLSGDSANASIIESIVERWVPMANSAIEAYVTELTGSQHVAKDAIESAAKVRNDIMGVT
jgi:toluene monooxygenase system protein E